MALGIQEILSFGLKSNNIKIDFDTIIPIFLLPLIFAVSTISLVSTIIVMSLMISSLLCASKFTKVSSRTQFFYAWTICSGFYLFLIFEFDILTMLEITQMENLSLMILFSLTIVSLYNVRIARNQYQPLATLPESQFNISSRQTESFHCQVCQTDVRDRYFHSYWLDCCISSSNHTYYLLGLSFAVVTLVFGANLGLTTVCHPYIFYKSILMPEDCSDVYFEFELALCFVASIYSLGYALIMILIILHQVILLLKYYLKYDRISKSSLDI